MTAKTGPAPARHAFTLEEWHRMGPAELFHESRRIELLDGEVMDMAPIGVCHALCVKRLNRLFHQLVSNRAIVSTQDPIILTTGQSPSRTWPCPVSR